ncbi:MAG: helix-turn-helix transcriptional regulator [Gammaproteobacteria bacterium]|nr:helix-turn-helix transcriptional regulator [Gammaproteobacteria bacterium]
MEFATALRAFDALSQETRLRAFRLLVETGFDGAPAGTLCEDLAIPHNTLSFHLAQLHAAGLVSSRRAGRSIIYTANFAFITELVRFMVEKCCTVEFASLREDARRGSAIIELSSCCGVKEKRK